VFRRPRLNRANPHSVRFDAGPNIFPFVEDLDARDVEVFLDVRSSPTPVKLSYEQASDLPKVLVRRRDWESGPIKPSNTQPTATLLKNVAVNLRCSSFAVLVDKTIALYIAFGYGTLSAAGLCWGHLRSKH
jgi:hypothetical protein